MAVPWRLDEDGAGEVGRGLGPAPTEEERRPRRPAPPWSQPSPLRLAVLAPLAPVAASPCLRSVDASSLKQRFVELWEGPLFPFPFSVRSCICTHEPHSGIFRSADVR